MRSFTGWAEASSFMSVAGSMSRAVFSKYEDTQSWQHWLALALAEYELAIENRFVECDSQPTCCNIAHNAYEFRCGNLHEPYITVSKYPKEKGCQGVYVHVSLTPYPKGPAVFTPDGIDRLWELYQREKQICVKSRCYRWSLGSFHVDIYHTPRSRLPIIVREVCQIALDHTILIGEGDWYKYPVARASEQRVRELYGNLVER